MCGSAGCKERGVQSWELPQPARPSLLSRGRHSQLHGQHQGPPVPIPAVLF